MAPSANVVTKDGWSSVSYGWTCGHCGLERLWFSSKQCRRCGAPKPAGAAHDAPADAAPAPRRNRKRGSRPAQKQTSTSEVSAAKAFEVLKNNVFLKDSQALAAAQSDMEKAVEADKLAKRRARPPEAAIQSSYSALSSRQAALAKAKEKVVELEEKAKKANEALEEAKQKAEKLQGEIDQLQQEYPQNKDCLNQSSDPAKHLASLRDSFQVLSGRDEAGPLLAQLENAFAGLSSMLAEATPTPMATDGLDDQDLQMDKESDIANDKLALDRMVQRSCEGLPEDEREAKKAKIAQFAELLQPRRF